MKTSRSLFARLTATQFLLVLMFQVLAMSIAYQFIVLPLLRTSVQDLSGLIAISAETWGKLPPDQRAGFSAALQRMENITLQAASQPLPSDPGFLPYGHELQRALRNRYGNDVNVRFDDTLTPVYIVDLNQPQTRLHFSFPQSRIGTNPYLAVGLSFGLSALLALIAAIALARWMTRPLRDIAQAAQQVGAGLQPRLNDTHGAAELDLLTQNFNRMVEEVHALLANRTTLLAGVSHDLRSPITRMRMALELAQPNLREDQYAAMERYLEQMNQLIADYLDFAQGTVQRPPQPIALGPLLAQLRLEHRGSTPMQCDDTDLTVLADPLSLQRVLNNLLDNAVRYGVAPIQIKVERIGNQAEISIADHGPGIPAAQRERVFEPFVRLESSRNSNTGGTGLGLAIVREVCRTHGWQVRLEANLAHGTTVRLSLPCA